MCKVESLTFGGEKSGDFLDPSLRRRLRKVHTEFLGNMDDRKGLKSEQEEEEVEGEKGVTRFTLDSPLFSLTLRTLEKAERPRLAAQHLADTE